MARPVRAPVLVVNPRRSGGRPWPAQSAGRSLEIESYAHASNLAVRRGHRLQIIRLAWEQMVGAGLAPTVVPEDVELI